MQVLSRRPCGERRVMLFAAVIALLLVGGLFGGWSVGRSSARAQAANVVHACAPVAEGQLRHVTEPTCEPEESLISFNEANGANTSIVLCAETVEHPLRLVPDQIACMDDLVVLTIPSHTVETRLCIVKETEAFRLQTGGECLADAEIELVIPVAPESNSIEPEATVTGLVSRETVLTPTGAPSSPTPSATRTGPEVSPIQSAPTAQSAAAPAFRTAANQTPITRSRRLATLEDGPSFLITLSATNADGNRMRFQLASRPTKGAVGSIFGTSCSGSVPNTCTASIRYKPARDEFGYDSFTYLASDGHAGATGTITIRINAVNDAPTFTVGRDITTVEDVPVNQRWATNTSEGPANERKQSLTFVIVSNSNPALFSTQPAVSPSGRLSYVPAAEASGSAIVRLRLHDSGGTANGGDETSSLYRFEISITAANDAPSFAAGPDITVLEDSGSFSVAWATDMDPGAPNESGQATRFVASTEDLALFALRPGIDPAGVLTFVPAPDANGMAVIRVRVRDDGSTGNPGDRYQSSPAHVLTITITPVNDEPVFSAGPDVTVRGSSGTYNAAWATDITPGAPNEGAQLLTFSITGNSNAGLFASEPAVAPDGTLTFTPVAGVSGSALITVELTDDGATPNGGDDTSSAKTFTITVLPPNVPPIASDQSTTTDEDTSQTITLSGSDAEGTALTFAISSEPAHGSLGSIGAVTCSNAAPNTCTADVVYTPRSDYNGADSFAFTVNDGADDSQPATASFTITAVNDAPVVGAVEPGPVAYRENDPATVISTSLTVSDVDSATLAWAMVSVSGNFVSGQDVLGFVDQQGIAGSYDAMTGLLILMGVASPADYQTALRSVTYQNASDAPATGDRIVTVWVDDGNAVDSASNSVSRSILVTAVNDAPVLTDAAATPLDYTENDPGTALVSALTVSDVDSARLAWARVSLDGTFAVGQDVLGFVDQLGLTGSYDAMTGVLVLAGTASPADYQTALRSVTYQNTSDAPDTRARTVTVQVDDGNALDSASNSVSRSISVTAVNDAPVVGAVEPGPLAYRENDPATAISASLTVSDVDSATLAWAMVSVSGNFVSGQDVLGFVDQQGIAGSYDAMTGLLILMGVASPADYQTALRSVMYQNASDAPATGDRIVTVWVDDGNAVDSASNSVSRSILVTAVNDAPVLSGNKTYSTLIDTAITVPDGSTDLLAGWNDPDGGGGGVPAVLSIEDGSISVTSPAGGAITGVNNATGAFTFDPPPGVTGEVTFTYRVCDNAGPTPACSTDTTVTVSVSAATN